ncbi:hypothetical protein [Acidianus sp. HS-5]|uniref:hypothetical protein n=1 Tax=Acidianus sp. HS-5 TaxID=2886040 RepID=UPI001F31A22A|nr:hypothetical protein [Acidianus sp. HS-5]BDC18073.1 hypothetical protein HS5_09630 [Acidianus sp. HS-5]
MIVEVIYNNISLEMMEIIREIKRKALASEIIFYKGKKNLIIADNMKIWEENDNKDPVEEIYDAKIIHLVKQMGKIPSIY